MYISLLFKLRRLLWGLKCDKWLLTRLFGWSLLECSVMQQFLHRPNDNNFVVSASGRTSIGHSGPETLWNNEQYHSQFRCVTSANWHFHTSVMCDVRAASDEEVAVYNRPLLAVSMYLLHLETSMLSTSCLQFSSLGGDTSDILDAASPKAENIFKVSGLATFPTKAACVNITDTVKSCVLLLEVATTNTPSATKKPWESFRIVFETKPTT